ncbi:hypothetical protein DUI87_34774 [Hirundo rustica rustica]|uniref:Uncharacterized protein n=1 Tax=Hirundo rustica rustica TaxID=333673 RepID=A0A3M0IL88_HIRRU|nr:hypothetical protein DUI87_34774 [Hirundo rustica rustica]
MLELPPAVMSQRGDPWSCQHGDVPERGTLGLCHSWPGPAPRALAAPGGGTKAELGGRQQDHGVQAPALHRQAKSGSLDIPGSSVQSSVLELQQPQSCEHCSGHRALGKGPSPGLGLGQWPREQINLQLLPQSREEQELLAGRDSCQGPAAPGHRPWLDTAWGQGELGCGDGLVPWEGGGALARVDGKAAAALEWLEVCKGWLEGTWWPEDMA